ncbi:MAG: hypothetical protein JW712_02510 [Dehalococcoidales bacterium]|nr:hypothetical protein [Dehalococcoidales bacterium]
MNRIIRIFIYTFLCLILLIPAGTPAFAEEKHEDPDAARMTFSSIALFNYYSTTLDYVFLKQPDIVRERMVKMPFANIPVNITEPVNEYSLIAIDIAEQVSDIDKHVRELEKLVDQSRMDEAIQLSKRLYLEISLAKQQVYTGIDNVEDTGSEFNIERLDETNLVKIQYNEVIDKMEQIVRLLELYENYILQVLGRYKERLLSPEQFPETIEEFLESPLLDLDTVTELLGIEREELLEELGISEKDIPGYINIPLDELLEKLEMTPEELFEELGIKPEEVPLPAEITLEEVLEALDMSLEEFVELFGELPMEPEDLLEMNLRELLKILDIGLEEFLEEIDITLNELLESLGISIAELLELLDITLEELLDAIDITLEEFLALVDISLEELLEFLGIDVGELLEILDTDINESLIPVDINLEIEPVEYFVGEEVTFTGRLTSGSKPLAARVITIVLDGEETVSAETDDEGFFNGVFQLPYRYVDQIEVRALYTPAGLDAGIYLAGMSPPVVLHILYYETMLDIYLDDEAYPGYETGISGTISYGENPVPEINRKAAVYIDDTWAANVTAGEVFTSQITLDPQIITGSHIVIVSVEAAGRYSPAMDTEVLEVTRVTPFLDVEYPQTALIPGKFEISGRLYSPLGPLADTPVKITFGSYSKDILSDEAGYINTIVGTGLAFGLIGKQDMVFLVEPEEPYYNTLDTRRSLLLINLLSSITIFVLLVLAGIYLPRKIRGRLVAARRERAKVFIPVISSELKSSPAKTVRIKPVEPEDEIRKEPREKILNWYILVIRTIQKITSIFLSPQHTLREFAVEIRGYLGPLSQYFWEFTLTVEKLVYSRYIPTPVDVDSSESHYRRLETPPEPAATEEALAETKETVEIEEEVAFVTKGKTVPYRMKKWLSFLSRFDVLKQEPSGKKSLTVDEPERLQEEPLVSEESEPWIEEPVYNEEYAEEEESISFTEILKTSIKPPQFSTELLVVLVLAIAYYVGVMLILLPLFWMAFACGLPVVIVDDKEDNCKTKSGRSGDFE